MRVISGKYKGKRFDVPKGFKARPTTDFAKESLFNILSNVYVDFDSFPRALDLFGGTGSIGVEFVSRGCKEVVSVEKDFHHFQHLKQLSKVLSDPSWHPVHADVFKYVPKSNETFDIVFADPPYTLENLATLPDLIFSHNVLSPDGLFILEHGKQHSFKEHPHYLEERHYGSVHFSFFR